MRRATRLEHAVAVLGMVVVWLLLWGNAGPFTVVGGVIVAVLALMVFPLPLVPFGGRVSPAGIVLFTACFLRDLVLASIQVSWLAMRPGPPPAGAIFAVPLRATSDLHMTLTAAALSLIPGSLVVEADRARSILYVHVIGVATTKDVDGSRAAVVRLEDRILRATGVATMPAVPDAVAAPHTNQARTAPAADRDVQVFVGSVSVARLGSSTAGQAAEPAAGATGSPETVTDPAALTVPTEGERP